MIELAEMRRRRLEALFRPMFLIGLLRLRILKKRRAKAEKAEKRAKRRKAKELSREETLLRGNERKVKWLSGCFPAIGEDDSMTKRPTTCGCRNQWKSDLRQLASLKWGTFQETNF